jgi:hypothetical protein
MEVPREQLTLNERRYIINLLEVAGREQIAEADALHAYMVRRREEGMLPVRRRRCKPRRTR